MTVEAAKMTAPPTATGAKTAPASASASASAPTEAVFVDGVRFDDVTMAETVERIERMAGRHRRGRHEGEGRVSGGYVCTGNLDHLLLLRRDAEFRRIYADADLVLADGMPVVWLSRMGRRGRGGGLRERVAGSDLFWELARSSERTGLRLFFLGGMPGAADRAAAAVRARFPGACVCGTYCPPFETFRTPEEQQRIADAVRAARPDVLMVGLGAPKQEKWIARNRHRLGVPVSIGVGGSFEMAGGLVQRAPLWARRSGMEWLFRLCQDPGRLFRRYILGDLPLFFELLLRSALSAPRRR